MMGVGWQYDYVCSKCMHIACRATVTPFLANMTVGANNFKWMLFGDDDTVFVLDNVLRMLEHLDPNLPYFITDHLWYPQGAGRSS